jgi:hypothetical protein
MYKIYAVCDKCGETEQVMPTTELRKEPPAGWIKIPHKGMHSMLCTVHAIEWEEMITRHAMEMSEFWDDMEEA